MNESDLELVQRYARFGAEDAFAELVRRYLGLVHSAALRQVRSPELAEEVAQSVFVDLARKATEWAPNTVLVAWLYQVTRRTAVDVIRRESRRQLREQVAYQLTDMNAVDADADWREIEAHLDEAMETLESEDRAAVLMRYFENKSLREVGERLGASENAAQKRIKRATERLSEFFRSRGITVGASGLAVAISANAVQAVPVGLGAAITAVAVQTGTAAVTAAATATAVKAIAMTTTQKIVIGTILAAAVGTGIYESREASALRAEIQTLKRQVVAQNLLGGADVESQLAALQRENSQLKSNSAELSQLRGDVARLKSQGPVAAGNRPDPDGATESAAKSWMGRMNLLKARLAQLPEASIPELALLKEEDWLAAVKSPTLETEKEYRAALSALRNTAHKKVAGLIQPAIAKYLEESKGAFPTDLSLLQRHFEGATVDQAILARYEIVPAEAIENVKMGGDWAVTQKSVADEEFDQRIVIGPHGYGNCAWKSNQPHKSDIDVLTPAYKAFVAANGSEPLNPSQLRPYLTTPEENAALERVLQSRAQKNSR